MARQVYRVTVDGEERMRFSMDTARAWELIHIVGDDGEEWSTSLQTGSVRHSEHEAARRLAVGGEDRLVLPDEVFDVEPVEDAA